MSTAENSHHSPLSTKIVKRKIKPCFMNQVTLEFPDLYNLWQFAITLTNHSIQIQTNSKTLTCNCTIADIDNAINNYKAKRLDDGSKNS